MMKTMTKLPIIMLTLALIFGVFGVRSIDSVNADTYEEEAVTCTIPRVDGDNDDEEFVALIEEEKGISREDENVFVQYNADGTTSVSIIEDDGKITVYTSPNGVIDLGDYPQTRGIFTLLWTGMVWLFNAYQFIDGVRTGCDIIKGVSGVDVCSYVGNEIIKSLARGTRKKYEVRRMVEKLPCPYPPHSQYCNTVPYAYYKTVLVPVTW